MTQTKLGNKGSMATTYSRICVRRDTAKNWHDPNVAKLPLEGEICLTIKGDPADPDEKKWSHEWGQIKIGDGTKEWDELEYYGGGGDAEVIVAPNDPAPTWPGGGDVPEGVLWFNTGTETLLIRVGDDWVKISPDNELYFAPSQHPPTSPINGDLWHVSDEGLLKIWDENSGDDGDWIPACAPPNQDGDPSDMVAKSGDDMHGRLKIQDDTKLDGDAVFKVNTGTATDQANGGFVVQGNGQVVVYGVSKQVADSAQLTTKAYVDNSVTNAGDNFVKYELPLEDKQSLHNPLFVKSHPDVNPHAPDVLKDLSALKDVDLDADDDEEEIVEISEAGVRTTGDGSYGQEVQIHNDRIYSPWLTLGNRGHEFRDGSELKSGSIWKEGYKLYMQHAGTGNTTPRIKAEMVQRINYTEVYNIRCDDTHPNPDYAGKNWGNTEGFTNNNTYTRKVYWSSSNIAGYEYPDGHPIQKMGWVADPDSSVYDTGENDVWGPAETRVATKGYVDKKIQQDLLAKGSDLCADSEDATAPGGFWRDASTGTIYLKVI